MVKPLTFKGDKKAKKRKRDDGASARPNPAGSGDPAGGAIDDNDDDDDSWVTAEAPTDVAGPIIFTLPSEPATCLACDSHGQVYASPLENMIEGDAATAEPHDVRQVWVATRIAGQEGLTFKGHHGRYLTGDKFGIVTATREAISPEETFLCIPVPDTPGSFAVQTQRDTFFTLAERAPSSAAAAAAKSAPAEIRADATEIGFASSWRIRMQARFKPRLKANKEEKAREKISRKQLEEVVGRRLADNEVKRLKRARREGDYHEAVLDVRVKGKHDKFASC